MQWCIINDDGEFWSNEFGWTGFDEATIFSDYDHGVTAFIPAGGRWAEVS